MAEVRELLEPILDKGIQNTNYFNGRLLSAEDLRADQDANRQQHRQLGRAMGDGIAYGFEVRESSASPPSGSSLPVLSVSSGLAINRCGQVLSLGSDIDVALIREQDAVAAEAGVFAPCVAQGSDELSTTGSGVYVLVVSPASGYDGLAPTSGLGGKRNGTGSCGSAVAVEGVQFRLLSLPGSAAVVDSVTGTGEAKLSRLRNVLAHFCFGTDKLRTFAKDPFRIEGDKPAYASYGAIDDMRSSKALADCDVPLALVYWITSGLQFLDMWAVRRRITSRAVTEQWNVVVGDRRLSEAEAIFMQFDDHLQALKDAGTNLQSVVASQYFRFLPPAGLLRVASATTFFSGHAQATAQAIDGAMVTSILRKAVRYEPVDFDTSDKVWIYTVSQNQAAVAQGVQPYFLFTTTQIANAAPAVLSSPPVAPIVASGLVEKTSLSSANVPGAGGKGGEARATSAITHGLGPVPVAIIIGLEDFGTNPASPDFERAVDRYYAFRDTGVSGSAFHIVAEVTKPYDGRFKIFTNQGTLEFFDQLRWWAIKVP